MAYGMIRNIMSEQLEVKNPYDLTTITQLHLQTLEDGFNCIDKSHQLFSNRKNWLPKSKRIDILNKVALLIESQKETLAIQATKEGGKPLFDSKIEISRAIEGVQTAIREIWQLNGTTIPMNINGASEKRFNFTQIEPRGIVFAISAFNHPFNLIVHQVITAIAAGCPVIIKPALTTPLSCKSLVSILYEAGLPADWCQILICEDKITEALISDPRIAFFSFVGSAKVGWHLRSKLAPGTLCSLEHGGVAPVIVDKSADINSTIPALTKGGYYHAGQVCVSVQRIFVHQSISETFIDKFTQSVQSLKIGDPLDSNTEVGPLILPKEVNRIHNWVENARDLGAQCLYGGTKLSHTCYTPTLLLNPPQNAHLSQQEAFGPIVCIYTYSDLSEAIQKANSLPFTFQAAVFSTHIHNAFNIADQLKGTTVMINDHTAFRLDWMPFGGAQHSGQGIGGIGYAMKEMSIEKNIICKNT